MGAWKWKEQVIEMEEDEKAPVVYPRVVFYRFADPELSQVLGLLEEFIPWLLRMELLGSDMQTDTHTSDNNRHHTTPHRYDKKSICQTETLIKAAVHCGLTCMWFNVLLSVNMLLVHDLLPVTGLWEFSALALSQLCCYGEDFVLELLRLHVCDHQNKWQKTKLKESKKSF